MTAINLLMITAVIVFVIDLSGFIQETESILHRLFFSKYPKNSVHIPKPFSCSLCTSFWTGLLYLLLTHSFSIVWIGYVCLLSYLTPVISNTLILFKEAIIKGYDVVFQLFNK